MVAFVAHERCACVDKTTKKETATGHNLVQHIILFINWRLFSEVATTYVNNCIINKPSLPIKMFLSV